LEPFSERTVQNGMSYGVSLAGYDVRVAENVELPPGAFTLGSTVERFCLPNNLVGIVHDKSTWARQGLAVQNTVIEPGWDGYLTLELTNHSSVTLCISRGDPIAQVIFHYTDEETQGYTGKYQDQGKGPQEARFE
jgi:dCTP deaminase